MQHSAAGPPWRVLRTAKIGFMVPADLGNLVGLRTLFPHEVTCQALNTSRSGGQAWWIDKASPKCRPPKCRPQTSRWIQRFEIRRPAK